MAVTVKADETTSKSQSAKVTFAKLLAGNNKKIRDKGLKKLNSWLTIKSKSEYEFTEEDFMTIWTGLYYSMWMSDMPLVQEDLAEAISMLVHCLKSNMDAALLFIKCFNITIGQAWPTIDQHRIDKFAMLVRRFLRQSLHLLNDAKWEPALVKTLMAIYKEHVLGEKITLGFKLHFIDIFLEELAKVSKGELSTGALMAILEPFARTAALTADGRVRMQCETFFRHLIRQTDVAIEYQDKFEAWRRAGFPGGNPNLMVKTNEDDEVEESEDDEDEGSDDKDVEGSEDNEVEGSEEDDGEKREVEDEEKDEDEAESEEEPAEPAEVSTALDPRAGSVHTLLPQIRPPAQRLAKLMKRLSTEPQAAVRGKKLMLALHRRFKLLQRGKYPFAAGRLFTNEKQNLKKMINQAVKKEMKEETNRKKKRMQAKLDRKRGNSQSDSPLEKKKKNRKLVKSPSKRKMKASFVVTELKTAESTSKRKNSEAEGEVELPPGWIVDNADWQPPAKKKKMKKLWEVSSDEPAKSKNCEKLSPKVAKVEKSKKSSPKVDKKEQLSNLTPKIMEVTPEQKKESPKSPKKQATSMMSTPTKSSQKLEDKKNEENGVEQEIVIEQKKKSPQKIPAFFSHAAAKVNKSAAKKSPTIAIGTPTSLLKETLVASLNSSKSGRRISFNLSKNMAQERIEYLEQLQRSPQIPFDPNNLPQQSALKQGLPPSPINPFYAMKLGLHKKQ